jgi:hypothetical protein
VFALERFGRKYNLQQVSAGLRPSKDGVLLSDLRQMLEAHDLEVTARQNVTVRGLAKALEPGNLAIFPLKVANGENHYFVAVLDRQRTPVIVNVLYGLSPLSEGLKDAEFKRTQGLVLFVHSVKPKVPMNERVRISPGLVNLGAFPISGPKAGQKLPAEFFIENTTSSPIMVSSVQRSCGCTKTNWEGGLIAAKKTQRVSFEVYQQAWGIGKQRKLLLLKFADGSERRVVIVGEGLTPEGLQKLKVSQKQIHVEVNSVLEAEERIIQAQAIVTADAGELKKLSVSSKTSWLTPQIVPMDSGSAKLQIRILMNDELIEQLADSGNRLTGRVTLSTRSDQEPVTVDVVIVRRDFFRVNHKFIRIGQNADEVTTVSILPRQSKQIQIKTIRLWSEPSGLKLDSHDTADGHVVIAVRADQSTQPGFFVVKCKVQSTRHELATASFVVRVEKFAR